MAELEFGNRDNIFNIMQATAPDGSLLSMAQNLVEVNPLIKYLPSVAANANLSHKDARWDSLPTPSWIALGDAVTATFGRLSSYVEVLGTLATTCRIEERTLKLAGSPADMARYRRNQERAHEEALTQSLSNALIRGTAAANHENLDGILNRAPWNDASNTTYVFDVGGTSNLRHALLCKPGVDTFSLLHPKYHPTKGIERIDRGSEPTTVTTTDANGTSNAVRHDLVTDFFWDVGWNIKNQKAVKIIANIDITYSNITYLLIRKVIEAANIHTVISSMPGAVNPDEMIEAPWHLFVDPNTYIQLITLTDTKNNVQYDANNPYKTNMYHIGDIMIHKMDALNYSASQIT